MKLFFPFLFFSGALSAIAVEYDLDRPLDFKLGWIFLRTDDIYLQHQCSAATAARHQRHAVEYIATMREKLNVTATPEVLQIRLHANAQLYRNRMKFSREREGHYNSSLNILTSHCSAPEAIIEQQLILHILRDEPLRKWQKIFIAEVLPGNAGRPFFRSSAKAVPSPLYRVLLANHTPEKPELATLASLARYLQKMGKLEEFALTLARDRGFDDTGMEILERLCGERIAALEARLIDKAAAAKRNNTLRKLKR
ncbi:MAG: hypothetical protein U1F27_09035 [Turneriella sp.]